MLRRLSPFLSDCYSWDRLSRAARITGVVHRSAEVVTAPPGSPRDLQDRYWQKMGIDIPGDGTSVPPDFVIAQRATLSHIDNVAKKVGLQEGEYDLYGQHKAKACS